MTNQQVKLTKIHKNSENNVCVGLFRAGILCSGSALPLWTVQEDPLALFSSFVSNIPLYSVYEATYGIKGALRKQSVPTLITAANAVPYTVNLQFIKKTEIN